MLSNGCRVIIVERLDRLARDLGIQLQLVGLLCSKGITLMSADTQQDATRILMVFFRVRWKNFWTGLAGNKAPAVGLFVAVLWQFQFENSSEASFKPVRKQLLSPFGA